MNSEREFVRAAVAARYRPVFVDTEQYHSLSATVLSHILSAGFIISHRGNECSN